MSDSPAGAAPAPEVEEIVDAVVADAEVPQSRELAVADPSDQHAVMVAMDVHDAEALVDRLVRVAQVQALEKRWVYELWQGGSITRGLTGDCIEDVVQQMNWTGKCAIRIVKDSAKFEVVEADEGFGPEPFWCVTVEAEDTRSGLVMVGTSMEPQCMRLKPETVARYEKDGKRVMEGGRVFDRFSRAKALTKAQRNALEKHVPEVVKQTIIAMAARRPELVEHIRTEAQEKVEQLPPPLDTPEAQALIGECDGLYDEVRELDGGKGKVAFPPGRYAAYMLQSRHSLEALEKLRDYLKEQIETLPVKLRDERLMAQAQETAREVKCPACTAARKAPCKNDKGKPKATCAERVTARRAQLETEA